VSPRRGDVWLVDFGEPVGREQAGTRPAVVVSADELNEGRGGVVIVIPTTTTPRPLPTNIEIDPEESGLDEVSYARCEDIKSISQKRLVGRLGAIGALSLFRIGTALRHLLDL
jgi:mRNA interferase MazF